MPLGFAIVGSKGDVATPLNPLTVDKMTSVVVASIAPFNVVV